MLLPWIDFMIVSLESLNHENMEHEKLLEQCFTKLFSLTLSQILRGLIFDLNSTQVWAIMSKSVIIKVNSLFHQNLGTIIEYSD